MLIYKKFGKMRSNITGFITVPERCVDSIDMPSGKVDFVALIGATDFELKAVRNKVISIEEILVPIRISLEMH